MEYAESCKKFLHDCCRLAVMGYLEYGKGNASMRLDGFLLTTPTGADYETLDINNLVLVDLASTPDRLTFVTNGDSRPTSEIWMHLFAAKCRKDMNWFVHSHKEPIPSFSEYGDSIPDDVNTSTYAVGANGFILCVPPFKWGSIELARGVESFSRYNDAFYLAKHGGFAMGPDFLPCKFNLSVLHSMAEMHFRTNGFQGVPRMNAEQKADAAAAVASHRNRS